MLLHIYENSKQVQQPFLNLHDTLAACVLDEHTYVNYPDVCEHHQFHGFFCLLSLVCFILKNF